MVSCSACNKNSPVTSQLCVFLYRWQLGTFQGCRVWIKRTGNAGRKLGICHSITKAISKLQCVGSRDPSILQNSSKLADGHRSHIQHSQGTLKQWTKRIAELYHPTTCCAKRPKCNLRRGNESQHPIYPLFFPRDFSPPDFPTYTFPPHTVSPQTF